MKKMEIVKYKNSPGYGLWIKFKVMEQEVAQHLGDVSERVGEILINQGIARLKDQ